MTIHHILVGVALDRPPKIDQFRGYAIEADTRDTARLTALQWACHDSVMPVWDGLTEDVPFLGRELLR